MTKKEFNDWLKSLSNSRSEAVKIAADVLALKSTATIYRKSVGTIAITDRDKTAIQNYLRKSWDCVDDALHELKPKIEQNSFLVTAGGLHYIVYPDLRGAPDLRNAFRVTLAYKNLPWFFANSNLDLTIDDVLDDGALVFTVAQLHDFFKSKNRSITKIRWPIDEEKDVDAHNLRWKRR